MVAAVFPPVAYAPGSPVRVLIPSIYLYGNVTFSDCKDATSIWRQPDKVSWEDGFSIDSTTLRDESGTIPTAAAETSCSMARRRIRGRSRRGRCIRLPSYRSRDCTGPSRNTTNGDVRGAPEKDGLASWPVPQLSTLRWNDETPALRLPHCLMEPIGRPAEGPVLARRKGCPLSHREG
jgi:hypothetical protein